jgi:hypothetical protein
MRRGFLLLVAAFVTVVGATSSPAGATQREFTGEGKYCNILSLSGCRDGGDSPTPPEAPGPDSDGMAASCSINEANIVSSPSGFFNVRVTLYANTICDHYTYLRTTAVLEPRNSHSVVQMPQNPGETYSYAAGTHGAGKNVCQNAFFCGTYADAEGFSPFGARVCWNGRVETVVGPPTAQHLSRYVPVTCRS